MDRIGWVGEVNTSFLASTYASLRDSCRRRGTQIGRRAIDGHVSTRTPYCGVIAGESLRSLLVKAQDM